MPNKLISIILPVYNEEANIPLIYSALKSTLEPRYEYEFIFINDGSTDKCDDELEKLVKVDPLVKVIEFSRNFGKEMATTAGIHTAQGDACIIIDADLQHPVAVIPEFLQRWEQGAEVVIGVRTECCSESKLRKFCSYLFYKLMNLISDTPLVPKATDFRLLDRVVINEFNRLTERNRMTRGLIAWLGFKRDSVYFKANKRLQKNNNYSLLKLFKLAMSTFVANSLFPLKLAGYLGIIITFFAGCLGLFVFITQYLYNPGTYNFSGPAQLAIINLFLIGIVLICLGLIALYVGSIHSEVTNRPLYVVRKKVNF